jgi:hypothetical protein
MGGSAAITCRCCRPWRQAGFRTTLISNAEHFSEASAALAAPLVRETLVRRNIGYDFGAWRDGLADLVPLDGVEQLLLCNDSVYGPFAPLASLLSRADPAAADVWGMTEGRNHGPHLQSYWLLFHGKAITHPAFKRFWRTLPYINDKFAVVEAGELGLSRQLRAAGLRLNALFSYPEAEAAFRAQASPDSPVADAILDALDRGWPMNPSHHFWRVLIAELGLPFIKRELLTLNPAGMDDLADWEHVVQARFGVAPLAAREHLDSLGRQRPTSPDARGLMRLLRQVMSRP